MSKERNYSAIENLPPELLMHILLLSGDPLYLSHFARASKKLKHNLSNTSQLIYWFTLYQRDFAKNPKLLSPEKKTDYKKLYIDSFEEWRKNSNLSKKHQRLFRSIRAGDLPSIKKQTYDLGSRNDFMDIYDQGATAVSLASQYERNDILAYFYEQMCIRIFSKKKQDNKGRTKLYWAAACNRLSEINPLICKGEDVNKTQGNGDTPLYIAVQNGHSEMVKTLLAAGADINKAHNDDDTTPLMVATYNGHLEIVKTLLAARADVNKTKSSGATLLYLAAQNGHIEVVKTLLAARADVNKAKSSGASSLYIAAQHGHPEVVKILLAAGADINKAHNDGTTPLMVAAYNGHLEIVKTLLAARADVNKAKSNGATSLYLAALNGHIEVVKTLLAARADVNNALNNGTTPLFIAVQKGHLEVVKTLLAAGADVNKANKEGTTPLIIAAYEGHQKIYSFLKLWKIKNSCKEIPLLKQVILLLEISIREKSFFNRFKTSFFSRKDPLYVLVNQLKNRELGLSKKDLKLILEENRDCIPLEKYEFILSYILADETSNSVYQHENKTQKIVLSTMPVL